MAKLTDDESLLITYYRNMDTATKSMVLKIAYRCSLFCKRFMSKAE